ncbi:hypothetical protein BGZ73_000588 [Actinomortierella ambigua]|nr:hypothetical protein BGZ73_000588 [Actinomortierella ambigua]
MKKTALILALTTATAFAVPHGVGQSGDFKVLADKKVIDIDKLDLGGLQIPSSLTAAMNTQAAPENYGNLNLGSGMMPSQIVHYGTESNPEHSGYIQPTLLHATGGHSVDVQHQQPEHALFNANLDRLSFDRSLLQKAWSPETLRALLEHSQGFVYPSRHQRRADEEWFDNEEATAHEKWQRGGGWGGGGWGGGGWGGGGGGGWWGGRRRW